MIGGRRILAVVPARGGSKGIRLKNLHPVLGVPLVARVGALVAAIGEIDRAVVSTDHPEIARVGRESGLDAPFVRPEDLSGDRVADAPVLRHALLEMERIDGVQFDVVVMLQPTSPIREPEEVLGTVRKLVDEDLDAVWTVSLTDSKAHPLKQLVIEDGRLGYYDPAGAQIIARQQLRPVYHRNGVAYALTRSCLVEQESIMGARTGAYVVDDARISIDGPRDVELVEFLMRGRRA